MINPSFQKLSEISPSRYEVCVMVMKRAALLTDGSAPLVKSLGESPVTVALDEIMARKVTKVDPETIGETEDSAGEAEELHEGGETLEEQKDTEAED